MTRSIDYRLYVLTDRRLTPDVAAAVEQAIAGGATVVQLREKGVTTRQWLEAGAAVRDVCRRHGVPFIVNDDETPAGSDTTLWDSPWTCADSASASRSRHARPTLANGLNGTGGGSASV